MSMKRVALATSATWPLLPPDDAHLVRALTEAGLGPTPVVWSTENDWTAFAAVIIRSCWDYHLRLAEFLTWAERIEVAGVRLFNPAPVIRWNAHKSYLLDLASRGIAIPRTQLIRQGDKDVLRLDAEQLIVKPAVSASAYETHFVTRTAASIHIDRLLTFGDVIVQEFVEEVTTAGEWSLFFFAGAFSHAVLKTPRSGDFRVQEELGGASRAAAPPESVSAAAHRVLAAVDFDLLYARVDLVAWGGSVLLMELELIEPSMFFGTAAGSAARFTTTIQTAIEGRPA